MKQTNQKKKVALNVVPVGGNAIQNAGTAPVSEPKNPLLEKRIQEALAPYPDPMSRSQFREACRIGTRTSLYLIKSGLVPCQDNGKKTRCYKIYKKDVAEYLRRRESDPMHYTPPSGWYSNHPNRKPPKPALVGRVDLDLAARMVMRYHYENELKHYPDVLTVSDISRLTGYSQHTVSRWCTEGRVKTLMRQPKFIVPKVWLLDFLCSDDYNQINRKSKKHRRLLK